MYALRKFSERHPVIFSLFVFPLVPVSLGLLQLGGACLLGFDGIGIADLQDSMKILSVLVYLLLLWRLGWLRPTGLLQLGGWKVWLLLLALTAAELAVLIQGLTGSFALSNLLVFDNPPEYVLVGLFEEIAFRGLIFYALLKAWKDRRSGIWAAVLVSSLMFGVFHMGSLASGNSVIGALFQSASSAITGVLYAGLVLFGGSLWPVIAGHFLVDAIGYGNLAWVTDYSGANQLIFWLDIPFLLIGLYLVSRSAAKNKAPLPEPDSPHPAVL